MADVLVNLAATLAFRTEESITVSLYNEWVIASLEDKDK